MDEPFSLAVAKHVFKILGKRSPSELAAGEIEVSLFEHSFFLYSVPYSAFSIGHASWHVLT